MAKKVYMFCKNCGYQGYPKTEYRGLPAIELLLYLFFIIPGLLYSHWRGTHKYTSCPKCGAENMIPLDSPIAQNIIKETTLSITPPVQHSKPTPAAKKDHDIKLPDRDKNGRFIIPES